MQLKRAQGDSYVLNRLSTVTVFDQ